MTQRDPETTDLVENACPECGSTGLCDPCGSLEGAWKKDMVQSQTTVREDVDCPASLAKVFSMTTEALSLLYNLSDDTWREAGDVIDGMFLDHVGAELQRRWGATDDAQS